MFTLSLSGNDTFGNFKEGECTLPFTRSLYVNGNIHTVRNSLRLFLIVCTFPFTWSHLLCVGNNSVSAFLTVVLLHSLSTKITYVGISNSYGMVIRHNNPNARWFVACLNFGDTSICALNKINSPPSLQCTFTFTQSDWLSGRCPRSKLLCAIFWAHSQMFRLGGPVGT